MQQEDRYLTLFEVVEASQLSESTVRRHIWTKKLKAGRVDGTGPYRVNVIDFHIWMRNEAETARNDPSHKE